MNLVARVLFDGITTHGHMRALVGAVAHALMLRSALLRSETLGYGDLIERLLQEPAWRSIDLEGTLPSEWLIAFEQHAGEPAQVSWKRTVDELLSLMEIARLGLQRGALAEDEATLADLGCFDRKINGAGTVTAVAAAYVAARTAARPMTGLLRSAFLRNADTDTLASMVASSLGALHGVGWLGELARDVQDSGYITAFDGLLKVAPTPAAQQPELFAKGEAHRITSHDVKRLLSDLEPQIEEDRGTFIDGRSYRVMEQGALESRSNAVVTRWRLALDEGQTIVVDRIRRPAANPAVEASIDMSPPGEHGSSPSTISPAAVVSVILLVQDLPMMAGFYRNILGLPVHGTGSGRVEVGPVLKLCVGGTTARYGNVVIEIQVPDIEEVRRRLGAEAPQAQANQLEIVDPEGNAVLLRAL
jgi:hypothetical protein